ncbi:MAG: amino acid permease [Chlamydiia bacterium]|nr:amino acid permease [Chlamydiia bacterium]
MEQLNSKKDIKHQKTKPLNILLLTGICISTILSIRNWPLSAEYGFSSLSLILISAFFFLIPVSLVSAELATGWPEKGGIYTWVKEAFGHKAGFASIWFVWISNVVWYPTILSFIVAAAAYMIYPSLTQHPYLFFSAVTLTFWGIILLNLNGAKISGLFSSACLIFGTIIPGGLIITFGFLWLFDGNPIQMNIHFKDLIPKISGFKELVFFSGLLLGFSGMEMPAVHASDVSNPQKSYPKAIFLSSLVIIVLSIIGTFSVGLVIPQDKISLVTATLDALSIFLTKYHLLWIMPILTILIALGALGGVCTWVIGPSKGLLEAAKKSNFPGFITKKNKNGVPVNILIIQGFIVTTLSSAFLIIPSLSGAFWILTALTSQLYLIAYVMMFLSGIYLRYKKPEVPRKYKIPGSNFGIWLTVCIGIISSCFAIIIGFFPPSQIEVGGNTFYCLFLVSGILLFSIPPFFTANTSNPVLSKHRVDRKALQQD